MLPPYSIWRNIVLVRGSNLNDDWGSILFYDLQPYPDIIVHCRETDAENLLVAEVKKKNSRVAATHDFNKLKAFTENTENNAYHYEYGVFILLHTGSKELKQPELTWFTKGSKE